jgi:ATP-dependent Clp protease ATP-binding subunit ClpC
LFKSASTLALQRRHRSLKNWKQKLEEVRKEKDAAVQSQEFEKAASLRDMEQRLREELEETKKSGKKSKEKKIV